MVVQDESCQRLAIQTGWQQTGEGCGARGVLMPGQWPLTSPPLLADARMLESALLTAAVVRPRPFRADVTPTTVLATGVPPEMYGFCGEML